MSDRSTRSSTRSKQSTGQSNGKHARARADEQLGDLEFSDWYESQVFEPSSEERFEAMATSGRAPARLIARVVIAAGAKRDRNRGSRNGPAELMEEKGEPVNRLAEDLTAEPAEGETESAEPSAEESVDYYEGEEEPEALADEANDYVYDGDGDEDGDGDGDDDDEDLEAPVDEIDDDDDDEDDEGPEALDEETDLYDDDEEEESETLVDEADDDDEDEDAEEAEALVGEADDYIYDDEEKEEPESADLSPVDEAAEPEPVELQPLVTDAAVPYPVVPNQVVPEPVVTEPGAPEPLLIPELAERMTFRQKASALLDRWAEKEVAMATKLDDALVPSISWGSRKKPAHSRRNKSG